MRALIAAAVLIAGGMLVLDATADAQGSSRKHIARTQPHKAKSRYKSRPRLSEREQRECEEARFEDPSGIYKGFPCWAQSAFARGSRVSP